MSSSESEDAGSHSPDATPVAVEHKVLKEKEEEDKEGKEKPVNVNETITIGE